MRWLVLCLLFPAFAGCLSEAPAAPEPAPPAKVTIPEPVQPWNATYSITWSPEQPLAGEPIQFRAALVGGNPPVDPRLTWRLDSASWSGSALELVLPAGDHDLRLEVAGEGTQVATAATVTVVTPAEVEDTGALGDPGPPTILVEQDLNEVRLSLEWLATPSDVRWFLGDEGIRTGPEVKYLYGREGTYTIIAHAQHGSTRYEARAEVTIDEVPLRASHQFTDDIAAFQMSWGETPRSVLWEFGDGGTSSEAAPEHTYEGPGPWNGRLTVRGAAGEESLTFVVEAATWPIRIEQEGTSPALTFQYDWPWEAERVAWHIEGTAYDTDVVQHTFQRLGIHVLTLALEGEGRSRTETVEVVVDRVHLQILADIDHEVVAFAFQWGPEPDRIEWDFQNDGRIDSTEAAPTHAYPRLGPWDVHLTVRSGGQVEQTSLRIDITDHALRILVEPVEIDGQVFNEFRFDFAWGERETTQISWDFGDGTSTEKSPTHRFGSVGTHTITLTVANATLDETASTTVSVDALRAYFVRCGDVTVPEDVPTHGHDPALGGLAWAAVKTGFRAVITWPSPDGAAGSLEYKVGPGPWQTVSGIAGRDVQSLILDDLPVGQGLCFRASQGGDTAPLHGMWLRNGPTSWDPWSGTYTVNTLTIANEGASVAALAAGYDWYAELMWESTDGYVAAGGNIILRNDADFNDGGRNVCAVHNVVSGIGGVLEDDNPAVRCDHIFDVVFAYDAESPLVAGNTRLDGIADPGELIWMNQMHEAPGSATAENGAEVGSVLLHEMGHYGFGMQDMYTASGQGPECEDPATRISIMGASRAAREFDDEINRCPNEAALPDYEPSWTSLIVRYPEIPDRTGAPPAGAGGTGPWYATHILDVGQEPLCTSIVLCD